jgi:hypothetical protein
MRVLRTLISMSKYTNEKYMSTLQILATTVTMSLSVKFAAGQWFTLQRTAALGLVPAAEVIVPALASKSRTFPLYAYGSVINVT